jgi:hypothetical protein
MHKICKYALIWSLASYLSIGHKLSFGTDYAKQRCCQQICAFGLRKCWLSTDPRDGEKKERRSQSQDNNGWLGDLLGYPWNIGWFSWHEPMAFSSYLNAQLFVVGETRIRNFWPLPLNFWRFSVLSGTILTLVKWPFHWCTKSKSTDRTN